MIDDPFIAIMFKTRSGARKQLFHCTLRELYTQRNHVYSIKYTPLHRYTNKDVFFDICEFDKLLEEMIHICLPDPNALLDDNNGYELWKHYMYELLLDND